MKILVLGGSGMVGHKIWQSLREEYSQTFASVRQKAEHYQKFELFDRDLLIDQTDVQDRQRVVQILNKLRPDYIINCIAVTLRRPALNYYSETIYLNSLLPHILNEWAKENSSKVIHFSTDCVFSGREGSYTEDSPTDAQDLYGQSKALGEIKGDHSTTIRCSFIGRELEHRTELLEWFLSQEGKTIQGFDKVIFSGVTTIQMGKYVKQLIKDELPISGIYQIASPQISKYDLLCRVRDAYGCQVNIEKDESHISNKSLIAEKFFKETGYEKPSWDVMIDELSKDPFTYQRW